MKIELVQGLTTVCALLFAMAVRGQVPMTIDTDNAWFRPSLEIDEAPEICAGLLDSAQRDFFAVHATRDTELKDWSSLLTAVPLSYAPGPTRPTDGDALADSSDDDDERPIDESTVFAILNGQAVYVAQTRQHGCGGYCDRTGFHASIRPWARTSARPDPEEYERRGGITLTVPMYGHEWLKSKDGRYFVAYHGEVGRTLTELMSDGSWRERCRVRSDPDTLPVRGNAELQKAYDAVRALDDTAGSLTGWGANCGRMQPNMRLNDSRKESLEAALYRPWSLLGRAAPPADGHTALPSQIEQWAALGIFERQALEHYLKQRSKTLETLARFYRHQFGWSPAEARSVATSVIANVVDQGFAFPRDYADVYADRGSALELRRAILDRRPLALIRAMPASLTAINGDDDFRKESLLSVAVTYPEALAYLLARGADPNRPNTFGKTPLMYAAQHNAVEGARLLLEHGANPNAATVHTADDCYYALSRTGVTPLHYAARYASGEMIDLLLKRGAFVFAEVQYKGRNSEGRLPLDWLLHYTATGGHERNPHIGSAEVDALAEQLRRPDRREREAIASKLALQAETEYAAGDPHAAYETLRLALQAAPLNTRLLSDMSLVALRAGNPDEAKRTAHLLTSTATDRQLVANAWFNAGLACEVTANSLANACVEGLLVPFLRSWVAAPTATRADKLFALLTQQSTCVQTRPEGVYRYVLPPVRRFSNNAPRRFWIAHPSGSNPTPRKLDWRPLDAPTATIRFVEDYEIGDVTITEYESHGDIDLPIQSRDFTCDNQPPQRSR